MKFLIRFICFVFAVVLLSSYGFGSRFHEVVDRVKSKTLKTKLLQFRSAGIEKQIDTTYYDSEKIIAFAKSYIGTRHRMNGSSKSGIDCSGLVMLSHKQCNINLPHNSHAIARFGQIVPTIEELQKGDLVFFCNTYKTADLVTHSGMYLGDGKFIHATYRHGVTVTSINDPYYWKEKFLFGTRAKATVALAEIGPEEKQ